MVQTCFIYLESLKEGTQADKHFQCFANIHGLVFQQSLKKHYICAIYINGNPAEIVREVKYLG